MDLTTVLVIYLVALLALSTAFYRGLKLKLFAAIVLALIGSWLLLIYMQPLTGDLTSYALMGGDPRACLYLTIWLITAVTAFAYLLLKALTDTQDRVCTRIF